MKKIVFFACTLISALCATSLSGQTVGLLKLDDLNNRLVNGGDTVFVVNFWATWCAPCVKELPYFQDLHENYLQKGVRVLLISLDSRSSLENKVKPFVEKKGLTAEAFLFNESNQQVFIDRIDRTWSGALPATLIARPATGKKIFREGEISYEELEAAIDEIRR